MKILRTLDVKGVTFQLWNVEKPVDCRGVWAAPLGCEVKGGKFGLAPRRVRSTTMNSRTPDDTLRIAVLHVWGNSIRWESI